MNLRKRISLLIMISICTSFVCCDSNNKKSHREVEEAEVVEEKINNNENESEYQRKAEKIERVDGPEINKTDKKTTLDKIEQWQNTVFTDLDYATKDKVIFHGDEGLIIYDLNNNKVLRALDLRELGMNHIQGDTITVYELKNDESELLIYNSIGYIDEEDKKKNRDNKCKYIYNIEKDTLKETNIESFGDEKMVTKDYGKIKTWDRKYEYEGKEMHCSGYSYIDENNVCFLLSPITNTRGISCLKLLCHKSDTDEEIFYNINLN